MSTEIQTKNKSSKYPLKLNDEQYNPCLKEQKMSYQCLDDNYYDREKCKSFFLNYNKCVTFWNNVAIDRKSKFIYPALPNPEEREDIKKKYKDKWAEKI